MNEETMVIAVVGIGGVVGIFWILAHHAGAAFTTWQHTALKRDMVARGYTVPEIVEVVSARGGRRSKGRNSDVPPAKPIKQGALATNH